MDNYVHELFYGVGLTGKVCIAERGRSNIEFNGKMHTHRYSVEDVSYATNRQRIHRNADLSKLPRNKSYNFVVIDHGDRGEIICGLVADCWEVGVKHMHLGHNLNVVSAGELRVTRSRNLVFNVQSGNYVYARMMEDPTYSMEKLALQTGRLFRKLLPSTAAISYSTDPLWRFAVQPRTSELAQILQLKQFAEKNEILAYHVKQELTKAGADAEPADA